jgi:hypothetical protein
LIRVVNVKRCFVINVHLPHAVELAKQADRQAADVDHPLHDLLRRRLALQCFMQLGHGHQHAGVTTTQKVLKTRTFVDKGREQQANQLCLIQAQGLPGVSVRQDATLFNPVRAAVGKKRLLYNLIGQVLLAHHDRDTLQIFGNPLVITPATHELSLQASHVSQQQRAGAFAFADMRGELIELEPEKLAE